jgi:hypothetical protein
MAEYSFQKAKIGKGFSYPLKRTILHRMIDEAMIERLGWVYYRRTGVPLYVLSAYRFGDSSKGAGAGLSTIIVHAVPSSEKKTTEELILTQGLPRLLHWLREIETSGNTRRGTEQHFAAQIVDGAFRYNTT